MKLKSVHILTVASIASVCISAFATDPVSSPVTSPIMLSRSDSFVPASFSADGNPMLSFTSFDETEGTAEVQVLDASIEYAASFTVPADPHLNYVSRYGEVMQNMYWEKIERDTLNLKSDELKDYLKKLDYDFIMKYCLNHGTSAGAVYGNKDTSYEVLPNGEKVIKHFIYDCDKYVIEVTCSGSCKPEITFDVLEERNYYVDSPLARMSLLDYDKGTSTIGQIAVTQTLFNNDPDFEYVSPLYEGGDDYSFDVDKLKWDNGATGYLYDYGSYFAFWADSKNDVKEPGRCAGFSIRKQNGAEVQTVKFEKDYTPENQRYVSMSIIIIGGKKYLSCNLVNDKTSYTVLYEIKKGENSVRQVGAFKTGVHPTLVTRGQNVMVDFENPDNDQISVSVTDLTGKVVYNKSVNSGIESLAIPSESMSNGMNIVTVYDNSQPKSSTKVMVR